MQRDGSIVSHDVSWPNRMTFETPLLRRVRDLLVVKHLGSQQILNITKPRQVLPLFSERRTKEWGFHLTPCSGNDTDQHNQRRIGSLTHNYQRKYSTHRLFCSWTQGTEVPWHCDGLSWHRPTGTEGALQSDICPVDHLQHTWSKNINSTDGLQSWNQEMKEKVD